MSTVRAPFLLVLLTVAAACGVSTRDEEGASILSPSFDILEDVTPPTLTGLALSPLSLNTTDGPATLTLTYSLTDDLSGAVFFGLWFTSPSGGTYPVGAYPQDNFSPTTARTSSIVAEFPRFSEAGTWTVANVVLKDAVGNRVDLSAADLDALGLPTAFQVESVSDVTPPWLTALSLSPSSLDTSSGTDVLTVDFSVADDLSGVEFFGLWFTEPSGGAYPVGSYPQSSFGPTGTHSGSVSWTFPQFSETGSWSVANVVLKDAVGNRVDLSTQDLEALGFPTSFEVSSVSDVTPPTLTMLSLAPATLDLTDGPAELTVAFSMTDDLAGSVFFGLWFTEPSGGAYPVGYYPQATFSAALAHSGTASWTFPQFSETGTWSVANVVMVDAVGNRADLSTERLAELGFPTDFEVVTALQVAVDIAPDGEPNTVRCTGDGLITVAVLSGVGFDATSVDHGSVTFQGAREAHLDPRSGAPRRHVEDVDGDGDPDLVFHFQLSDTDLTCASTNGTLVGFTFDGRPIRGTDSIRMIR